MTRRTTLLVLLVLLVLLAGCSTGGEEEAPRTGRSAAPAEQTAEPAQTESEDGTAGVSPTASAASVPTEAIASAPGDRPGLILEVLELRRSGETVTLNFAIANQGAEFIRFDANEFLAPGDPPANYGSMSGVTLTDDTNSRRHLVLRQPDGACVCSIDVDGVDARSRNAYFAKFSAPPDDVDVLSVQVPNFGAIDSVPLAG